MTELKDRLDRLADAAVGAVHLDDPSTTLPGSSAARRRAWPWIGAVAAAVVLVVAVVAAIAGGGRDGAEGPLVDAGPGTTDPARPVLSVVLPSGATGGDLPTVQIVGPDGDVGPLRSASEVTEPLEGGTGEPVIARGLITRLPAAGAYEVVISFSGVQITCPFEAATGQRLILALDGGECGQVQTVDEWAPEDTDVGLRYVGLPEDEAVERIADAGYESLVVGRDGLWSLSSPEPGRMDLWVYDGVVAAANGVGRTIREPRTTLALVMVSDTGGLAGGGTVMVRLGPGDARVEQWEQDDPGSPMVGLVFDDLPLGPATIDLPDREDLLCSVDVDLADPGTVVTIAVAPDGSVLDTDCSATVETLDEHVARVAEGWDRYEPAEAYLGLTEAEAEARAEDEGLEVRVVDRDGVSSARTDDLRTDRVNLVVFDDEVRAAAVF